VLAVLFLAIVLAVVVASTVSYVTRPKVRMSEDAACPPLLTHTSNGADDYGDVIEWHGQSLWRTSERTRAGDQVGVVGCSISTMPNPEGLRVAPLPWPDGTSTVLPRGTTLHLPQEREAGSGLVARTAGGDVLYCPDVPGGRPTC
jgi:hypothetical protein